MMQEKKKINVSGGELIAIVVILLLAVLTLGGMIYQKQKSNSDSKELQEKVQILEEKISNLEGKQIKVEKDDNLINNVNDTLASDNTNIANDTSTTQNQVSVNKESNNNNSQLKKYTFYTPVGDGVFEINADFAIQLSGFAGASAHIFYLIDGDLYYHNTEDVKLASGILDIGRNNDGKVFANTGKNKKVYVENQYVEYINID